MLRVHVLVYYNKLTSIKVSVQQLLYKCTHGTDWKNGRQIGPRNIVTFSQRLSFSPSAWIFYSSSTDYFRSTRKSGNFWKLPTTCCRYTGGRELFPYIIKRKEFIWISLTNNPGPFFKELHQFFWRFHFVMVFWTWWKFGCAAASQTMGGRQPELNCKVPLIIIMSSVLMVALLAASISASNPWCINYKPFSYTQQ